MNAFKLIENPSKLTTYDYSKPYDQMSWVVDSANGDKVADAISSTVFVLLGATSALGPAAPLLELKVLDVLEAREALLDVADLLELGVEHAVAALLEALDEVVEVHVGHEDVRPLGILVHEPLQVARLVAFALELNLREGFIHRDHALLVVEEQLVRKLGPLPLRLLQRVRRVRLQAQAAEQTRMQAQVMSVGTQDGPQSHSQVSTRGFSRQPRHAPLLLPGWRAAW